MTVLSFANHLMAKKTPTLLPPDVIFAPPCETPLPEAPLNLAEARRLLAEAAQTIDAQKEAIRRMESQIVTDDLTGLLNRQGLRGALRRELQTARRNRKNLGLLILLDIDGFAALNQIYGRPVGDAYLQTVANVLLNEVRASDYVARLGDDSFAILLPQIAPRAAGERLDKLDKTLNGRVMHNREHSIPLSASFGFAVLSENETPESLLIAADMKLFANRSRKKIGMKS